MDQTKNTKGRCMGEKRMLQRGVKGSRNHGATAETHPRGHGWPPLQKRKLYLSLGILGGIAVVMFTLLGMLAYRNSVSERELLLQNALLQGYWIARSLEISHRVATQGCDRSTALIYYLSVAL